MKNEKHLISKTSVFHQTQALPWTNHLKFYRTDLITEFYTG